MLPKPKKPNVKTPEPENLFSMQEDLFIPHEQRQTLHLNYSHPEVKDIDKDILTYAMSLSETSGVSPDRLISFLKTYKGKSPKNALMNMVLESRNKRLQPQIQRENQINENRKKYFTGK